MAFGILKSLFNSKDRADSLAGPTQEFVAFVTPVDAPHFIAPNNMLEGTASMRLRVGLPARELARSHNVWLVPIDYHEHDPELARLGRVRAVVLGKLTINFFLTEEQRAIRLLDWLESLSPECRVIADFSDDLEAAATMLSRPVLATFQQRLLRAFFATASTEALRERLALHSRHGIAVIEDPYELPAAAPRFAPDGILRLMWFGVFGPPLRPFIEAQFGAIARRLSRQTQLAFVTHSNQMNLVSDMAGALAGINDRFSLRFVPWSLDATARELAQADIVVLPHDLQSDWSRVKSHNRLVESIRAGRFAVASPIPSYVELKDYGWIDEDLCGGIEWAVDHPHEVISRVVEGQAYIATRFAPTLVAARWAKALHLESGPLLGATNPATQQQSGQVG